MKINWRDPRLIGPIIGGIFVLLAAIITGIFIILQPLPSREQVDLSKYEITTPPSKKAGNEVLGDKEKVSESSKENFEYFKFLDDNQIRKEISNSLHVKKNLDKAIKIVKYLGTEKDRNQELDRIFNYCIDNGKLEKAEIVVELYNSREKKEKARKIIAEEKLKRNVNPVDFSIPVTDRSHLFK